jgi:hypothetical protein
MATTNMALTIAGSGKCTGCSIGLGADVSSSAVTLTRNVLATTKVWNPSDSRTDGNGSHVQNRMHYGALTKMYLKPTLPFAVFFSGW